MQNRQVIFVKRPIGEVTLDCFDLRDAAIPKPADGEVLIRNIYLSCDPYMRGQMGESGYSRGPFQLNNVLPARVVGQVVQSRRAGFNEGDFVWGFLAWELYTCHPANAELWHIDPEHGPISHGISVLGMPGLTAYAGMMKYGKAKPGETVFVSAASGAVGQVAGQLGRIAGARVVGSAGSDAKVDHMKGILGFDAAFNYRKVPSIAAGLDETCPDGIDVYFDNVGGETLDAVLARINEGARVPICGQISQYDVTGSGEQYGIRNVPNLLRKHATMTGFSVRDNMDMFDEFLVRMAALMKAGDVVYTEDIIDGLDNTPSAFIGMMRGENIGKRLMRVGDDPTL